MPWCDSTRKEPRKITVNSSKSGCWPGSVQPDGLRMWAMLTPESFEFTRPMYSSNNLPPGTGIRVGFAINVGMPILVIAFCYQVCESGQSALIGGLGELGHDRSSFVG